MGLLTDPSTTKQIGDKINKYGGKLAPLGFICGICWFILQSSSQFNAHSYIDENALQPRMATPKFSSKHRSLSISFNKALEECETEVCRKNLIKKTSSKLRLKFEDQQWKRCDSNSICEESSNIIVRLRPIAASVAESIIINIPMDDWGEKQRNMAFGTGLALMALISDQLHWGKDIYFIFSTKGRNGLQCWLESNFEDKNMFCSSSSLTLPAASPQTGIVLYSENAHFSYVNLEMEGDRGQMANQDLVNVAVRCAASEGIKVTIMNETDSSDFSPLFFKQMLRIGAGQGTGNHADLIKYGVHAITLRGVSENDGKYFNSEHYGRLVEHILRSENNLLERLHASIWFYIFSSTTNYSSISLYMPSIGLLLLIPCVTALNLWNMSKEPLDYESLGWSILCGGLVMVGGLAMSQKMVPLVFVVLNVLPFLCASLTKKTSKNAKAAAISLLLYALIGGISGLLCFTQGFVLLVSASIISLPLFKINFPYQISLISHPGIFMFFASAIYMEFFGIPYRSFDDVLYSVQTFSTEMNTNLFSLWILAALPSWSVVLYHLC